MVPEPSAATRRQDQFSDRREERGKAGGQAMLKTESQAYERIAAGSKRNVHLREATSQPETTAQPSYLEYKNTKTVLN